MEPGWKECLCASCGQRIWPDGDPDWGFCFECFTDNVERKKAEDAERDAYYAAMASASREGEKRD